MFAGHRRCCRSVLGSRILSGNMPVGGMLVGGMLMIGMLASSGALPAAVAESLQRFQRSEPHMGTTFGVVFYAADEATANRASAAVFARVAELNRVCSDYDASSELSRLSARAPTADVVWRRCVCSHTGIRLVLANERGTHSGSAFLVADSALDRSLLCARGAGDGEPGGSAISRTSPEGESRPAGGDPLR